MVDILVAAYNGVKYLARQLNSLLAQTEKQIRILVRDDGSSDGTDRLLADYEQRYPEIIHVIRDAVHCGGPAPNFMELVKHAEAEYIMFCDQDDFWKKDKVSRTLEFMRERESLRGQDCPILVFSDYIVSDAALHPLPVKEKQLQVYGYHTDFSHLLVQNYITGCTTMMNRAAYRLMGDYDRRILMHDWWAAQYVSALGEIVHLPEKLMYYCQHGDNVVSAVNVRSFSYRVGKLRDKNTRKQLQQNFAEAGLLYERFGSIMPAEKREILEEFLRIPGYAKPKRMAALLKGHFLKGDLVRVLGQLYYV
ncbi:MAG: glycosyltransferase family 2 protein [Eubacterium sp.]|nr:glycosyltransferase family 2 protein [Eubacterium sp.]